MTETVQAENTIVISPEARTTFQNKTVERKTIVHETRVDSAVLRIAAENPNHHFFIASGFLRPKPEKVTPRSMESHVNRSQ